MNIRVPCEVDITHFLMDKWTLVLNSFNKIGRTISLFTSELVYPLIKSLFILIPSNSLKIRLSVDLNN